MNFTKIKQTFFKALNGSRIEIIKRTQAGKDVNGKPFVSYSKKYAEYKKDSGRSIMPVNLTFTFNMLGSIQTDIVQAGNEITGRIVVPGMVNVSNTETPNAATKAYMHNNGAGKMPKREFFGLSKVQKEKISDRLKNAILKEKLL